MSRADKQIEFAVFCIENTAKRLGTSGQAVYRALCETDGINKFIIPSYDILHTQSKEYIFCPKVSAWEKYLFPP